MENTGKTNRKEKEERSERGKSTARRGCTQNRDTQRNRASWARVARSRHISVVENSSACALERFIVCDATLRRNPAEGQEVANSRLLVWCEFLEADIAAPDPCMSAV
jgi:hypothetical protein